MRLLAPLLLLALTVAACQPNPDQSSTSGPDIVIASNLTTQGSNFSNVAQLEQAIRLAITKQDHIKKFKLGYLPFEDYLGGVPSQAKGIQNVNQMIANARVLGMVGPFASTLAFDEIPAANPADLAMLSPSNTDECITRRLPICPPGEPPLQLPGHSNNYFRIAGPDSAQGRAMARYISKTLGVKRVAAFNEWGAGGDVMIKEFGDELARAGGKLVVSQELAGGTTSFRKFLDSAKAAGAEAIYAVGNNHVCAARAQMTKKLFPKDLYFVGVDGLVDRSGYSTEIAVDDSCIKDAVGNGEGILTTFGDVDPTHNTDQASMSVVAAYRKAYPKSTDISIYTFAAYDCARILIDAITRAIDANGGNVPTRAQVVTAVANTQFEGVTGTYSFDAHGDALSPLMSIYKVENGHWVFMKAIDASTT